MNWNILHIVPFSFFHLNIAKWKLPIALLFCYISITQGFSQKKTVPSDEVLTQKISKGLSYQEAGKYLKAIELFQEALINKQKANDANGQVILYQYLGNLYLELSETERSIEYLIRGIAICQSEPVDCPPSMSYNLFRAYFSLSDTAQAQLYLEKYIDQVKAIEIPEAKAKTLLGKGQMNQLLHKPAEAATQLRAALALFAKTINQKAQAETHLQLAKVLQEQKVPDSLIHHLQAAERLANQSNAPQILTKIYLQYSSYYDEQQNHKLAYLNKEKYSVLQDSLLNSKTKERINLLNDYLTEEQQKNEVILLEQRKELSKIQLQSERAQTWIYLPGILLLILLSGFSYNEFRKGRERNIALAEAREEVQKMLTEREFLLSEVHHRVKNDLQTVTSLLRMQRRHLKDPLALKALQEGQDRIQTMALLHQFLYKEGEKNLVQADAFFQQLIENISHTYSNQEQEIKVEKELADIPLSMEKAVPLSLILTELLTNAFKYGFAGKSKGRLFISLKKEGELLKLKVIDDGVGFKEAKSEEIPAGFGFTLIRSFTKKLKAELNIESHNGTAITLSLKS